MIHDNEIYNKKTKRGHCGERIVANYLVRERVMIQWTLNLLDNEKDLYILNEENELTVEVKTQDIYINKNAFTIKYHQLNKCMSADIFYGVTVPTIRFNKYQGKILQIDLKNAHTDYYTVTDKNGFREMIAIPLDQPAVKVIYTLNDKEVMDLQNSSDSEYY